jgi:hypothetical protein
MGDSHVKTLTRRGLQLVNCLNKVRQNSKLCLMISLLDTCNTDYLVGALVSKYHVRDFTLVVQKTF